MNNLSYFSVFGSATPLVIVLVFSDLILKGVTLFKSAQRNQKVWFIALLLINSLGILPIIYLILNKDIRMMGAATSTKRVAIKKTKRSRK